MHFLFYIAITMSVQLFEGEFDNEGIFVYQAYCNEIADYAIEHQTFGGSAFDVARMTWIKPSFAWVLYRSGYAMKHNQERILKIKLSHKSIGEILENCSCKHGGGGSFGRVQWDPARDLFTSEDGEPRKMLNKRAIQIGIKGHLSEIYVKSVLSIEDVTNLAHSVGIAHGVLINEKNIIVKNKKRTVKTCFTNELTQKLPNEQVYMPKCSNLKLEELGLLPGKTADYVAKLGKGC